MASVMGINKIGLPKLSENMDPEDARALRMLQHVPSAPLVYLQFLKWEDFTAMC